MAFGECVLFQFLNSVVSEIDVLGAKPLASFAYTLKPALEVFD